MSESETIAALRAEVETLREQLTQMRAALESAGAVPLAGLTKSERLVLGVLARQPGQFISRERIWTVLYSGRAPGIGDGAIPIFISRLRSKLGPLGVEIETMHGVGWRLCRRLEEAA